MNSQSLAETSLGVDGIKEFKRHIQFGLRLFRADLQRRKKGLQSTRYLFLASQKGLVDPELCEQRRKGQ